MSRNKWDLLCSLIDLSRLKKGVSLSSIAKICDLPRSKVQSISLRYYKIRSEQLSDYSKRSYPDLSFVHNPFLKKIFEEYREARFTVKQMYTHFMETFAGEFKFSQSYFYRHFIQNNGLRYKIVKYTGSVKDEQKLQVCRRITACVLHNMIEKNKNLYFFDESTFELLSCNRRAFSFKNTNYYFKTKLYMIASLNKVICFKLTQDSTTSHEVFEFIQEFCHKNREDVIIISIRRSWSLITLPKTGPQI